MKLSSNLSLLEQIFRIAVGLSFTILILAVTAQVLGRSLPFIDSPVWTEEVTRFALLYLAAFGVGLSLKSGDLVNVDIICEALPGKLPWFLRLLASISAAFLCALLILPAWKYTAIGAMQTSPALGVRMDWIHASVLVLLLSLLIFSLLRIVDMISGRSDGRPEQKEEN